METRVNIKGKEMNKYFTPIQQHTYSEKILIIKKQVQRKVLTPKIWIFIISGNIISKQANIAKLILYSYIAAENLLGEENV